MHTPALPWLVCRSGDGARYQELLEADIRVLALEPYGVDTWQVLKVSSLMEPAQVDRVRQQCSYGDQDELLAFYPLAIVSDTALNLGLSCRYSSQELAQANERVLSELADGSLKVSATVRQMMGDGYSEHLPVSAGQPLFELLEMQLDDRVYLVGWGWVWHRA